MLVFNKHELGAHTSSRASEQHLKPMAVGRAVTSGLSGLDKRKSWLMCNGGDVAWRCRWGGWGLARARTDKVSFSGWGQRTQGETFRDLLEDEGEKNPLECLYYLSFLRFICRPELLLSGFISENKFASLLILDPSALKRQGRKKCQRTNLKTKAVLKPETCDAAAGFGLRFSHD